MFTIPNRSCTASCKTYWTDKNNICYYTLNEIIRVQIMFWTFILALLIACNVNGSKKHNFFFISLWVPHLFFVWRSVFNIVQCIPCSTELFQQHFEVQKSKHYGVLKVWFHCQNRQEYTLVENQKLMSLIKRLSIHNSNFKLNLVRDQWHPNHRIKMSIT